METRKIKLPEAPKEEFDIPAPAAVPGLSGNLPLPVARVMKPKFMTDQERKELEAVGVKEGDAIPEDMAKRLHAVAAEAQLMEGPIVDVNTPPLQMPEAVHISALPDAHKQEIFQAIQQAQAMATAGETEAPVIIADQIVEIKDDVTNRPEKASESATGASVGAKPSVCQNCGHDLTMEVIPDPDEDTRLWYLQGILGNRPFEKTVSLFDGALEVTFRELTVKQSDAVYNQAGKEIKLDEGATIDQFLEKIRRYRLTLQLKSIRSKEKGLVEFDENPEGIMLPEMFAIITKEAITSVTLGNVISRALDKFNRIVSKLEAGVERENFWPAA